jgi:hypothetical protein
MLKYAVKAENKSSTLRKVIDRINQQSITDKKLWLRKIVMAIVGERERSG